MNDEEPLDLADFDDLLPLARAWERRTLEDASRAELAELVRAVEPEIEALNDFFDDQEGPPSDWPADVRRLKHLADLFNEAAFDDAVWRLAFPQGPPDPTR